MDSIKILLVEPNESTGELITKSLQRSFDAEVIFFKTSMEAVDLLKEGYQFSLVIVRNFSKESASAAPDLIADCVINCIYDLSLSLP